MRTLKDLKYIYRIFFYFIFFFLIGFSNTIFANIIQTSNLLPIKRAIELNNSENTLVIFDVDNVILMYKDQILQKPYKKYNNFLAKKLQNKYSKSEAEKLWSIIMLQAEVVPVDPNIQQLIKETEKNGTTILALTKTFSGSFGDIPSVAEWRIQELEKLGISFKNSFPNLNEVKFNNFQPKTSDHYPMYKDGIIFTADYPKGEVLSAFLNYAQLKPKNIIFVDDKLDNIISVKNFCKENIINFIGFEYTAVNNVSKKILNKERATYQFEILEKEHRWVSDERVLDHRHSEPRDSESEAI